MNIEPIHIGINAVTKEHCIVKSRYW